MMNDIGKICQEIIANITGKTTRFLEETEPIIETGERALKESTFRNRVKVIIQKLFRRNNKTTK
jgi:hypothetical protein